MRAKKHLREAALEDRRQEKKARVDEVEAVQEHSLQLISRVAEPGTSAPIPIWARLQALKRTLALESEARFLHEAFRTPQLLDYMEIGHKREMDECARISPSLKARAGEFIATPSPLGDICTLDWSPVELVHRVRQALSVADRCFESIVVKAPEHTWVKRHQTIDFQQMPGIFEAPARTACVDACACMCGPQGKLLQRFASQASKKARMQLGCGELVLALVGQQRGDAHVDLVASIGSVLLGASPLQSVRWLHIASHSFSPWQSGFSEMDAQEELEEEPVNLPGEMKLKARVKFFTRVQMAQSVDLAATRWVGCLYEVMFSQTPLGEFRPNELLVKKLPATMGLLWHPWCKRTRKSRRQDFGSEGVEDNKD